MTNEDKEILLVDLFQAYYDARKNKRHTINQIRFEIDYEKNLIELHQEIIDGKYRISPSICFVVNEPVKREIFAADFRDRVIHHLIFNYINRYLDKGFIEDSYSCRKSKGTLFGIRRVQGFIEQCSENYTRDCYILKLDVRGYFMSINKQILYEILESDIERFSESAPDGRLSGMDPKLILQLIRVTLDDNPVSNCKIKGKKTDWAGLPHAKSLFHLPEGTGLPIGNLTSQLFSNVYLNILDHFVTKELGMEYYGRYVDDFVIVHTDKKLLKQTITKINDFLREELKLELHPLKIYLQHYSKGVNFLGATLKPYRSYISRRTKSNFTKCVNYWSRRLSNSAEQPSLDELEEMRACINSYLGLMKHHCTYNIRKKVLFGKSNQIFKYGYLTKGLHCFVLKKKYQKKYNYQVQSIEKSFPIKNDKEMKAS